MKKKFLLGLLLSLSAVCFAKKAQDVYLVSLGVPHYPPLARTARVQGVVQLKISINAAGEVTDASVLSGHKMLAEYALKDANTLRFGPLSGNKPLVLTITYKYILDDHLIEGNDCCRFKLDGPTTIEVYAGEGFAMP